MLLFFPNTNIIRAIKCRRLRWAEHVAIMEAGRSALKILTGKPKRWKRKWEDNIRIDLKI